MKAIAYNIKPDEKEWLVLANYKKHDITIIANSLTADTLSFATGKEALLVFNNDELSGNMILGLRALGIKYIATSSSQTDHLDLTAAGLAGMKIANVPLVADQADTKTRMEQVIKNLDQWAAGKCVGKACCCQNECATAKKTVKMESAELLKKYNVAAPRYTSYPTVPYWDIENFNANGWLGNVANTYAAYKKEGISLYIHLPFCESLCTYCGCNTRITKNHSVEVPYILALLAEWRMYVDALQEKPKLKELHLGGGTPTFFSAENLELLINGIMQNATLAPDAELSFEAHPANTTKAHLTVLYQVGFRRLSLGIQDFDPKVQFLINRFQTPEQVANVTGEAREIGYTSINFDLIYGLPGQSIDRLERTISDVITMKPDRIAFYSYAHVPWLKPGQRHYTEKDIPAGDEKFALYQFGRKLLLDAGYEDVGMDHFALKSDLLFQSMAADKLHRNFMGYTSQHTHLLIGLGVSSISDSWTAFAQNPKTVEAYLDKIAQKLLPVEKGHFLTDEDLGVRKHILNIMCRANTAYSEGIPEKVYERLLPLLHDKLVWVTEKEIRITTKGKSFLRNVCMAFDEKLWLKQPKTQLFSSSI